MDNTAEYTDPVATVKWEPPLLQVKCQELADVEIERDVTVLNLAEMRRLFRCANKAKRYYKRDADRQYRLVLHRMDQRDDAEDALRKARESRRRLVCYLRGL